MTIHRTIWVSACMALLFGMMEPTAGFAESPPSKPSTPNGPPPLCQKYQGRNDQSQSFEQWVYASVKARDGKYYECLAEMVVHYHRHVEAARSAANDAQRATAAASSTAQTALADTAIAIRRLDDANTLLKGPLKTLETKVNETIKWLREDHEALKEKTRFRLAVEDCRTPADGQEFATFLEGEDRDDFYWPKGDGKGVDIVLESVHGEKGSYKCDFRFSVDPLTPDDVGETTSITLNEESPVCLPVDIGRGKVSLAINDVGDNSAEKGYCTVAVRMVCNKPDCSP